MRSVVDRNVVLRYVTYCVENIYALYLLNVSEFRKSQHCGSHEGHKEMHDFGREFTPFIAGCR